MLPSPWETFSGVITLDVSGFDVGNNMHFLARSRSLSVVGPNLAEIHLLLSTPMESNRVRHYVTKILDGRIHLPPKFVPCEVRMMQIDTRNETSNLDLLLTLDDPPPMKPPANFVDFDFHGRPDWLNTAYISPRFLDSIHQRNGLMSEVAHELDYINVAKIVQNRASLERGIAIQPLAPPLFGAGTEPLIPDLPKTHSADDSREWAMAFEEQLGEGDRTELHRALLLGFTSKLYWEWSIWNYECEKAKAASLAVYSAAKLMHRRMESEGFYVFTAKELKALLNEIRTDKAGARISGKRIQQTLDALVSCNVVTRVNPPESSKKKRGRKTGRWRFVKQQWTGASHLPTIGF